ncbi:MAG TPA: acyltransferase [Frateuria sp.]|uniref:acyltransferase family protein n=1 Tax=Frateuria sp. TaxID=2211372 RepID=UPI002D7FF9F8|nr:acyltransferase [Frateuria sp.]HET6804997.1 acyltransferase [Frateuria sp.]
MTTIQAGRAVAALLVVLFHLSMIFPEYWGHDPAHGIFTFGHSGVQFFFVLSGFIIFYIHRPDIGAPGRVWNYLTKRFIRIYPVYWVVLAAVLPVLLLVPAFGHGAQRQWSVILASFTLLRVDALQPSTWYTATEIKQAIVPVSWTLFHEVLFYLMFAIAIRNRISGAIALGLWFVTSLTMLAFSGAAYPVKFLLSPLHLLFAMGLATCWFVQEHKVRLPAVWAIAGVLLYLAVGTTDEDGPDWTTSNAYSLLYGVSSAMAIAGLASLEQQGRIAAGRLLQLLGDASYSIYLIHFTMFSAMAKVFQRLGVLHVMPPAAWYAALFVIACVGGTLLHLMVEKPLLRSLRARILHGHPPATANARVA